MPLSVTLNTPQPPNANSIQLKIDLQEEDGSYVIMFRSKFNVPFRLYFKSSKAANTFLTDIRNTLTDMTQYTALPVHGVVVGEQ